jgi:hypothetical protein
VVTQGEPQWQVPNAGLTPWTVSTMSRAFGSHLFVAGFGGLCIGAFAHGGDKSQPGGGSAADALFSPIALVIALVGMGAVVAYHFMRASTLEGTDEWIRRLKPAPQVKIALAEIVHLTRTRPLKVRNQYGATREAQTLGFTITTADGRSLAVPEAAVYRQPRLLQFYEAAFATALRAVSQLLAASQPLMAGDVALYRDRLAWRSGLAIPLSEIGLVSVRIGQRADVYVFDRAGRNPGVLPDDEMLLQSLRLLGVPVETKRVAV